MLLINKTLLKYVKIVWIYVLLLALTKMVTLVGITVFSRVISDFLGTLFLVNEEALFDCQKFKMALFAAIFAMIINFSSEMLQGEFEYKCSWKLRNHLRKEIYQKVLELDVGNVEKIGAVSTITTSVDGIESLIPYYTRYLPGLIYSLAASCYLFVQLKKISFVSAVIFFSISFVMIPLNNSFRKKIEQKKAGFWRKMEDLTGYYLESLRGIVTIKLFNRDADYSKKLESKARDFCNSVVDIMKVNFQSFMVTEGLIYGAMVIGIVIAAFRVRHDEIMISSALMLLLLSYCYFNSIRQLMTATHSALNGVSAAEKIKEVNEINTSRREEEELASTPLEEFQGIELRNVSFRYARRENVLNNVSLKIKKGEKVAIAGLSGCGKSTIANLLMRFNDVMEGDILLNNRSYYSLKPEELRKNVVMVPQVVSLFSGSIADNLRIAKEDAVESEMMQALERVKLKEFVDSLDEGLNYYVGNNGDKLSGGQRQKMGIARALLAECEYMIFDEATSSVDIDSETEIWRLIGELSESHTLILISHRLSTIEDCDTIFILQNGQVQESGKHDELMANKNLYYEIVMKQRELETGKY